MGTTRRSTRSSRSLRTCCTACSTCWAISPRTTAPASRVARSSVLIAVAAAALAGAAAIAPGADRQDPSSAERRAPSAGTQWLYGGGPEQIRYSALRQITRENVGRLAVAWTFDSGETGGLQTQPVVVDGVLYASTPTNKTFAL